MLKLENKDKTATLTLASCLGCNSPGCGKFDVYTADIVDHLHTNVVTRLFLHSFFGREHVLQGLVNAFERGWNKENTIWKSTQDKESKLEITSPLKVWHHIILREMERDKTWKTCNVCQTEYEKGTRVWEKIYFVAAPCDTCRDHKTL